MLPLPPGWCVYVLRCRDGSLYTGATNDLARRIARHAAGTAARYTRSRLPVRLVHAEPVDDRSAALRREAAVKRLTRAEKLALVRARASGRSAPRGRANAPRAPRRPATRRPRPSRPGTPTRGGRRR